MNPSSIDTLKNNFFEIQNVNSSFNQYYHLTSPYNAVIETYRSDLDQPYFKISSFSPEHTSHSLIDATELLEKMKNRPLHQHDFFELLFVVDGTLYQNIENRRHLYIPGSCCLLNKNVRHTEEYSTDFRVIFFQFSDHFIKEIFSALSMNYFKAERDHKQTQMEQFLQQNLLNPGHTWKNYIDFIPTNDADWTVQNVHSIFEQITRELLSPQFGSSAAITSLFFKLFHLLDQPKYYQTSPVKIGTDSENLLFQKITRLMEKSNGRMSRHELESSLHYSGDYLNKIVKKYTGLAIFDYGMTFCMKRASSLLQYSNMTISEIARQLGFSNRTHFYKVFQNTFSLTPSEYRRVYRTARK